MLFVENNIRIQPQAGEDITLTLDIPLQRLAETQLQAGLEDSQASGGTVVILDADQGAVLAMASTPDFSPANFREAQLVDYVNPAVESVLEPASVMKVLLMSVALNEEVIAADDYYYDPPVQVIDGRVIPNFLADSPGRKPVVDILNKSLNTGSIEVLKRLSPDSPPDTIDLADRQILYDYYVNRFLFNEKV